MPVFLRFYPATEFTMLRRIRLLLFAVLIACGGLEATAPTASAVDCWTPTCCCSDLGYMKPIRRAQYYNWNRNYSYTDFGAPTALVVPPTAHLQTNYRWDVASSRRCRVH